MKKILFLLLALCLTLSCVLCLASCDESSDRDDDKSKDDKNKAETKVDRETDDESGTEDDDDKEVVTQPDGYRLFDNEALIFAYPEGWTMNDGSIVYLMDNEGSGNNINVVYEDNTDIYDGLTASSFKELMEPYFESVGASIGNVKVRYVTNDHDLPLMVASYETNLNGTVMKQTQYVTTLGDKTYTVTVTEVKADAELPQVVFDTLRKS